MANVEIELSSAGIQALLKSEEMAEVCEKEASRMTRATGMTYQADIYIGRTRVNAGGYQNAGGGEE